MSKRYELVQDKLPLPRSGFVRAFQMALIDLSCFGEGRVMDVAGYPHESEAAAMMSDWTALGVDIRTAAGKLDIHVNDEGESDVGGERRLEEAPKGLTD